MKDLVELARTRAISGLPPDMASNIDRYLYGEIDRDPTELPDDQIVPDETEPLLDEDPPKTDPVPDE